MKKEIALLCILFFSKMLFAQNQQYFLEMGKAQNKFKSAKTVNDYQNIEKEFIQISNYEQNEWLPLYFIAQAIIFKTFAEPDKSKIDPYLDSAQIFIDRAFLITPGEPEIYVLQGLLYQSRISVNPMKRGRQFTQKASESFEKAKAINPENPRIYYLEGQSIYNTPKMFGGGKKNALPLFKQAKEKFDKFEPATPISPNWGKEQNEQLVETCQN